MQFKDPTSFGVFSATVLASERWESVFPPTKDELMQKAGTILRDLDQCHLLGIALG